jgi:hypothetical protein
MFIGKLLQMVAEMRMEARSAPSEKGPLRRLRVCTGRAHLGVGRLNSADIAARS